MAKTPPPSNLSPNIEFCLRLAQETSLSVRDIARRCKISSTTAYRYINKHLGRAFIAQRDAQVRLGRFQDSLSGEAIKEIEESLPPGPVKAMAHKPSLGFEGFEVIEIMQDADAELLPAAQSPALTVSIGTVKLEFEKCDEQAERLIAKLLASLREESL